jgi:hypothetical protein
LSTNYLLLPARPLILAEYIAALIDLLGEASPAALARLKLVVGDRRARIWLDDESVEVVFEQDGLLILPPADDSNLSGEGATNSATVLALLNGELEVADAILSGRLRVAADAANVARMFSAIEILLDAAPRTPALQELAARFQRERLQYRQQTQSAMARRLNWYPFSSDPEELSLLNRLDLLP